MKRTGTIEDSGASGGGPRGLEYQPGDFIAGRYEVREALGRGASSVVYRVLDHAIQEEIAVKIIDDPAGGIERIRHEVKLARRITHPNVIRVFDIVEHRHGALLSMELARLGTLADQVGKAHSDEEVRKIAAQVLDGLKAAHDAGIIHRDLKPANVLLGDRGRVILTDFGIAQPTVSVGMAAPAGTPGYMAPEQLRGEKIDARADLHAVGVLLRELLGPRYFTSALTPAIEKLSADNPSQRPSSAQAARALLGIEPHRSPFRRPAAVGIAFATIIAGGVGLWRTQAHPPAGEVSHRPPTQRAFTRGEEQLVAPPAFLPGGKEIVVATDRSGSVELWAVSTRDALARQLTAGPRNKNAPHVAGEWLYFLRESEDGHHDLARLPLNSLGRKQADDEATLVYPRADEARAAPSGRIAMVRGGEVRVVETDGREVTRASQKGQELRWPTWAPGERKVALVRRDLKGNGDLLLLDLATGHVTELAKAIAADSGMAFSPSGGRIVFFRRHGEERALVMLDLASRQETNLAERVSGAAHAAVGADGQVAIVLDSIEYDLWLHGGEEPLRRMTLLGDEDALAPHWVPDRGELAYLVHRIARHEYELLFVKEPDFSEVTRRRAIPALVPSITLSADGREIAYGESMGDRVVLQLAPIDGSSAPRTLHSVPQNDVLFPLQFVAGGSRIAFVHVRAERPSAWDVSRDGGDARLLLDNAGNGFRSASERWMAISREGSPTGFFLVPLGSGSLAAGEPKPVPGESRIINARWHPTTGELVVMDEKGLAAIDPETMKRRHLQYWPFGTRDPDRLAVHPDGRIACSLGTGRSSLVMLDGIRVE
ncbi:MAG: protein kinase [Deltaproteobacteria bacterium]|nr:protein kinase [Deltaproteobacteria bacterium]